MDGGTYFNALLDEMSSFMGSSTRTLENKGMIEKALYDFLARYSLSVSSVFIFHFLSFIFFLELTPFVLFQACLAAIKLKKQ